MSITSDRLREHFNHDVTDSAANEIDELEQQITKLREHVAAQVAVIETLKRAIDTELNPCGCVTGCEFCNGKMTLEQALAIPTGSTQVLAEVRRAERERCAKACKDFAYQHPNANTLGPELNRLECAKLISALE